MLVACVAKLQIEHQVTDDCVQVIATQTPSDCVGLGIDSLSILAMESAPEKTVYAVRRENLFWRRLYLDRASKTF